MLRRPRLVQTLLLFASALCLPGQLPAAAAGSPPKIRSVTPTYASRGASVDVTIEGSNLFPLEDASSSANDVNVIVQPGANEHKLVLRLTIPDTTPAGPMTLKIKTKDGSVTTDKFQVRLRLPSVSKVVPDAVRRGGTYDVTLSGTNLSFVGNETAVTTEAPMTVTHPPAGTDKKTNDKQMLLKLVVPPETPAGPHSLTIETTDGKFTVSFQVLLSPPSVTGIDPAAISRGGEAVLTLKGQNLLGATVVLGAPDDQISVISGGEATATAVPVKVEARSSAAPGPRLLVLQTADGIATATFDVKTSPPKSLMVVPPGAVRGTTVELTATGDGLPADAELRLVPLDPGVRLERSASGVTKAVVAPDARTGPRTIVAVTKDGMVTTTFNVGLRAPSVAGVVPAEVAAGTEADLAFEGQNLDHATYALVGDPAGVQGSPSPKSPAMFHVKAAADARPGPRLVLVRTPEGTSVVRFSVTGSAAGAPSAKGISPGRVLRGRPTTVVVKGMNLRAAGDRAPDVVATADGGGAIAVRVTDSTPSELTLEVTPPVDAALGGGAIVITTPDGVAGVSLQVDPALPSLAAVSPARASRPAKVDLVLTGTRLMAPGGDAPKVSLVSAKGGTPVPLVVASATPEKVTAKLALDPSAVPGSYLLVLESAEGGAAVPFEVAPAPPAIVSIAPTSVGTPAAAELVLTGRNLLEADGKLPKVQVTRLGATTAARVEVVKATAEAVTVRVTTLTGGAPGPHFLLLRTADGVTAGVFQIVSSPPPEIASLDQTEGAKMSSVLTIVHGSGLKGATGVSFDGKGVTAVILPGGSDQELHVRIVIAADADEGAHGMTVTAPGGVTTNEKVVFRVK